MGQKYDVVCVGFVNQDIILKGIDRGALERDSTHAEKTTVAVGGDAANQAVVLAKLGKKTALIANFGEDAVGRQIECMLGADGVDLSLAVRKGIVRSNISVAVIKENGERSFLFGKGEGDLDISMKHIDISLLEQTRAVSLGSLYFLKQMDQGGAAELFCLARERGVLTFADMTADAYHIGPDKIASVYPYTDYLMPSLEEAYYTTGKKDLDGIADYFLDRGVRNVVLKMGEKGCFIKNREKRFYTAPFQVEALDTTGCGDNFCAAFISAVLDGSSIEESARFAAAAGALNATCLGAHEAIRSRSQIIEFMDIIPQIFDGNRNN